MAKTVISIEIGAAKIHMAELVMGKTHQAVKKADIFDTPDGTMEDGFVRDGAAVAEAINAHILSSGMTAKEVIFAVSSTKIVSREVTVQAAKEKLLKNIVDSEANDYFPMDLDEYVVTYSIIGKKPAEKSFRLMVYAIPAALLQTYYDLATELRKDVASIDVEGNALFQWFKRSTLSDVSLVVQVNATTSLLTVLNHGDMGVQRSIGYGANMLANVLSEANAYDEIKSQADAYKLMQEQAFFGIGASDDAFWRENEMTRIRAQRFKKIENEIKTEDTLDDLDGPKEEKETSILEGLSVNEILERRQDARSELADTARQLTSNIRRVLDYYATKNPEAQVQKIYLTGLGASLMGLDSMIAAELQLPTEMYAIGDAAVFVRQAAEVESKSSEFLCCFGAVLSPLGLKSKAAAAQKTSRLLGIAAGGLFVAAVVVLGAVAVATKIEISNLDKEKVQLETDIRQLEPIESLQAVYMASKDSITFAESSEDMVFTVSEQLNGIIAELEEKLPSRAMVSSFNVNGKSLMMNMTTVTKEEAAKLLIQLKKIPYITNVTINSISQSTEENENASLVSFSVVCDLQKYEETNGTEVE